MVVGFTDSRYFRRRNVVSYGFVPIEFGASEHTGVHGIDERIGIKQMGEAIRRMVSLLEIFGEARK
jgi:acetylornithine deacetylase/succinyl-diaminopimelate desuccinylase-like protein